MAIEEAVVYSIHSNLMMVVPITKVAGQVVLNSFVLLTASKFN